MPSFPGFCLVTCGLLLTLNLALFLPRGVGQEFAPTDFWEQVQTRHPLARQAALLVSQGAQELRYARGAFDPKAYASHEQKIFGDKTYYSYGGGGIKLPTAWGIALKAGYDWTSPNGVYLNPERNIPAGGQALIGLEIPLLRGLLFDEGRAEWRQAQVGQDRYQALADELRNMLFLESQKAYWEWSFAYYAQQIALDAQAYSRERLTAIRQSFLVGDNPAIDTLEAFLQLQSWQLETQEASLLQLQAVATMQTMLWDEQGQPLTWNAGWVPVHPAQAFETPDFADLQQRLLEHPSLVGYQRQLEQLAIERRWKQEQFKPELTFNYNLLADRFDFNPGTSNDGLNNLVTNNFKWGFTFSQALFLRKERAGLALTEIKIAQTEWKRDLKQQELTAKLNAYWQEWQTRQQQLSLAQAMTSNYDSLLAAEQVKFELGESSVFLLNSRQQKLLNAQLKLLKTQADLQKNSVALWYIAGRN